MKKILALLGTAAVAAAAVAALPAGAQQNATTCASARSTAA